MKTNKTKLSSVRIKRIREQGYYSQCDQDIIDLAFGNRFAFRLCTSFIIIGVVFANTPLLSIMMLVAFMSVLLPNHVFDYIYNNIISKQLNKPKLPPRSSQLKFSCSIATIWIGATIYLFSNELFLAGYIVGGMLIGVASLLSIIDLCIPSIIYNSIFNNKTKTIQITKK